MASSDASVADLVRDVVRDSQELIREELALARAEMREHAAALRGAALAGAIAGAALGGGGLLALLAVSRLLAALLGWPVWGGYAAMAAVLLFAGSVYGALTWLMVKRTPLAPVRTIQTLKDDVAWMQNKLGA